MNIIDGKKISNIYLEQLKSKIKHNKLSLAVIQVGDDLASSIYIKQKENMAKELKIDFKHLKFKESIDEKELLEVITKLNKSDITGILVQLPIPDHYDILTIQNAIDSKKDVDGFHFLNVNKLINNKKSLIPCTAKGIITLLKYYNISLESKNVVVIGRSNIVGRPISDILLNENATVTICHSKTKKLRLFTRKADILIVAAGQKHLIKSNMVKKGVVIIDVGITKFENKLYGDVDFEKIKRKAKLITPVPGGVGPMTVYSLFENLHEAYLLQKSNEVVE
ncbi:MAG: bifunctional 5,10-methylenetetrahydrofolate dehydrogenase/5,10-methenyltetrahydrofolate cyclohydrolase [Bacilli bacterium]|nr:bifunctional 5,10-methylenetetrahydrofolate dehydrogenase/5,10-methenyltetrahydrofolate cyclohydrolase [Bacilli bacterium]